jgi:hypothetical protein
MGTITITMKFDNLKAGETSLGKPFYNLRAPAGEGYYSTDNDVNTIDVIFPGNKTKVKGNIKLLVNGVRELYNIPAEAAVLGHNDTFTLTPHIKRGEHLSARLDCKSVEGQEPYMFSLNLH